MLTTTCYISIGKHVEATVKEYGNISFIMIVTPTSILAVAEVVESSGSIPGNVTSISPSSSQKLEWKISENLRVR